MPARPTGADQAGRTLTAQTADQVSPEQVVAEKPPTDDIEPKPSVPTATAPVQANSPGGIASAVQPPSLSRTAPADKGPPSPANSRATPAMAPASHGSSSPPSYPARIKPEAAKQPPIHRIARQEARQAKRADLIGRGNVPTTRLEPEIGTPARLAQRELKRPRGRLGPAPGMLARAMGSVRPGLELRKPERRVARFRAEPIEPWPTPQHRRARKGPGGLVGLLMDALAAQEERSSPSPRR